VLTLPPLSLYIHLPWCIRKCPYCDFNSHTGFTQSLETQYIDALIADLTRDIVYLSGRKPRTIFFGGGTPSLFSVESLDRLLQAVATLCDVSLDSMEITLEANPGTFEQAKFTDFHAIGVNRLSLGIQSFQDDKLTALGRIHDSKAARQAVSQARQAGFTNFNIDLMYGLPGQTVDDALYDLTTAMALQPTHLSWYQLTIEPNTVFYNRRPDLPDENTQADIERQGSQFLALRHFHPYEISAHTMTEPCQHNLNYWLFGDYLGIGAGGHSKITDTTHHKILRWHKRKQPGDYLNPDKPFTAAMTEVTEAESTFEFMLNTLRLYRPVPFSLFEARTGIPRERLGHPLTLARQKSFIEFDDDCLTVTPLGHRYLNELTELFL
jgi:putative oxygen-independent coproporphyrinogen III oxidase